MSCLNEVFPVILYMLGSILIVVFIVVGIKLINTLNKLDKVVDDVAYKASKLNGLFRFIDTTADTMNAISDTAVNFITNGIQNIFTRKSKKKEGEENE